MVDRLQLLETLLFDLVVFPCLETFDRLLLGRGSMARTRERPAAWSDEPTTVRLP